MVTLFTKIYSLVALVLISSSLCCWQGKPHFGRSKRAQTSSLHNSRSSHRNNSGRRNKRNGAQIPHKRVYKKIHATRTARSSNIPGSHLSNNGGLHYPNVLKSSGVIIVSSSPDKDGIQRNKSGIRTGNDRLWSNIPGAIYFYTKGKPYYEFTNFAEGYPFRLKGDVWYTTEQYYQAQKFVAHPHLYRTIRDFRSDRAGSAGKKAFDFAQAHKAQVDPSWNSKSLSVMEEAVYAKFSQNAALRQLLKRTGHAVLVEDSPVDFFFGCGNDGTGNNFLGRILMDVRTRI